MLKSLGKIFGKGAMDSDDKNETTEQSVVPEKHTQPVSSNISSKPAEERPASPDKKVPENVSLDSDTTQVRDVSEEKKEFGEKVEDVTRQLELTSINQSSGKIPAKETAVESTESKADEPVEKQAASAEKVSEPTDEKPAEEKSAEEKPAEEKPAEEKPAEEKPKPRPRAEDFFESETKVKKDDTEERVPSRNSTAGSDRRSQKEDEPISDNPLNRSAAEEEILSSIEHVEDWAEEEKEEEEEAEEDEDEEELNEEGTHDEQEGDDDDEEEEETAEKELVDFDRDRRNPQFIPRGGLYFLHDDRLESSEDDETSETEADAESSGKEVSPEKKREAKNPKKVIAKGPTKDRAVLKKKEVQDKGEGDRVVEEAEEGSEEQQQVMKSDDKWTHDLFDSEAQQGPSSTEIQSRYGYDIRGDDHAPRGKKNRRYARPNERHGSDGLRRRAGGRTGPGRRLSATSAPREGAANVQPNQEGDSEPIKVEQVNNGPSTSANQTTSAPRNNPPSQQKNNTPQSANRPAVEPRQSAQSHTPERHPERKKVVEKYPAPSRQRQPAPQRDYQYSHRQEANYGSSDQYDNSSSDPNNANAFHSRTFFGRGRGRGTAGRTRGRGAMGPSPSQRPPYRENRSEPPLSNYNQQNVQENFDRPPQQSRIPNTPRGAVHNNQVPPLPQQRGPIQSHSNIPNTGNTQGTNLNSGMNNSNSPAPQPQSKRYSSRGGGGNTAPHRGGPSRGGSAQKENMGHESGDVRAMGGYQQPQYSQRGGQGPQGYGNNMAYVAVPPPQAYGDPNVGYGYPPPPQQQQQPVNYYGPPTNQSYFPNQQGGYYYQ